MVNDFRMFAAWALGVISALLVMTLLDANALRGWTLCVYCGLLVAVLLGSFWRVCGTACAETVQFLQCSIDAYRIRKGIDNLHKQNGLIIRPGEKFEADTWERQAPSAKKL